MTNELCVINVGMTHFVCKGERGREVKVEVVVSGISSGRGGGGGDGVGASVLTVVS